VVATRWQMITTYYTERKPSHFGALPVASGADSIGHGATCPPPTFYKWLSTGGTMGRRTADKKLTKLYCPSRNRSPKRLIVTCRAKKSGGVGHVPVSPLLNSFRRHCQLPAFRSYQICRLTTARVIGAILGQRSAWVRTELGICWSRVQRSDHS